MNMDLRLGWTALLGLHLEGRPRPRSPRRGARTAERKACLSEDYLLNDSGGKCPSGETTSSTF